MAPARSRRTSSANDCWPTIRSDRDCPGLRVPAATGRGRRAFVRKRIFDGTYAAGEYVRLDQLAADLGISVTPVREALFELKAEGLHRRRTGRAGGGQHHRPAVARTETN